MPGSITINFSDKLAGLSQIDKLRLQMGIFEWVFGEIDSHPEWKLASLANQWTINIHESNESQLDEFRALVDPSDTLANGIPHGITLKNIKQIDVFIPNIGGDLGIRQAFSAISHEICHMMVSLLVDLGVLPSRSRRRLQDKTMPPGSEGNTETTEVHDRENEVKQGARSNKTFSSTNHNVNGVNLGTFELVGIDITDLINKLENDN